jgi:hypothetical protein
VLGSAFLASCSSAPHVSERKSPILESLYLRQSINPAKLTEKTEEILKNEGLLHAYRKNPDDAIISLRRILSEKQAWEIRLALIEISSDAGEQLASGEPMKAVGYHLAATEVALPRGLKGNDNEAEKTSLEAYNFSCGRVAKILFENGHDWNEEIKIDEPGRNYHLRCRTSGKGLVSPAIFDELWATRNLTFKGLDHLKRVIRPGFGEMMVGHRGFKEERRTNEPFLSPAGMGLPLAVTIAPTGKE